MNIWTCKVIILIHASYVYIRNNIIYDYLSGYIGGTKHKEQIKGDDRGSEASTQK